MEFGGVAASISKVQGNGQDAKVEEGERPLVSPSEPGKSVALGTKLGPREKSVSHETAFERLNSTLHSTTRLLTAFPHASSLIKGRLTLSGLPPIELGRFS